MAQSESNTKIQPNPNEQVHLGHESDTNQREIPRKQKYWSLDPSPHHQLRPAVMVIICQEY